MRINRSRLHLCVATAALMLLGGCANPFVSNYAGRRQTSESTPVRVMQPIEARRLGVSRFDIDSNVMGLPDDAQARAAAEEVGAAAYYWKSTPKFHGGNLSNSFVESNASSGNTKFNTQGYDDKLIRWYEFEAIFYADDPVSSNER